MSFYRRYRDHRSGIYIFDCPKIVFSIGQSSEYFGDDNSQWLQSLLKVRTLKDKWLRSCYTSLLLLTFYCM